MFPVVANITTVPPPPTALVATPLPDTLALRVPFYAAPPSVSSAQIGNNARGNGAYVPLEDGPGLNVPVANPDNGPASRAAVIAGAPVSATFLAQLIAQNASPALQSAFSGLLSEYEKIVANSFIKYKPSFATLPQAEPSHVFGKILGHERPVANVPEQPAPVPQPQTDTLETPVVIVQPIRVSREEKRDVPKVFIASAASAYKASATRADAYVAARAKSAG